VVACEIKTGFVWPLGIWERPPDAGPDYEHPKHEVDGVVQEALETYSVWRLYADDQWIEALIERWQNRYGEKRVLVWRTNRPRQIAWAVRNFEQAIHSAKGELTHSGDETLTRHIQNSRKRKLLVQDDHERQMHTLAKPAHHSPLKIDGAMAAVLAWEARGDAIAARVISTVEQQPIPEPPQPQRWEPGTALPASALTVPVESGPMGALS
jgi:phage terminase large subunit-like protein